MKEISESMKKKIRKIYKSINNRKITAAYFEMDYSKVVYVATGHTEKINEDIWKQLRYKTQYPDDTIISWVSDAYIEVYGEKYLQEFRQQFIKNFGQYTEEKTTISGTAVDVDELEAGENYQIIRTTPRMKVIESMNLTFNKRVGRNFIFNDDNYKVTFTRNDLLSSHHILSI